MRFWLLIMLLLSACRDDSAQLTAEVSSHDAGEDKEEEWQNKEWWQHITNYCRDFEQPQKEKDFHGVWVNYLYDYKKQRRVASGKLVDESVCTFPVLVTETAAQIMHDMGMSCGIVKDSNNKMTGELRINFPQSPPDYGNFQELKIDCETVSLVFNGEVNNARDPTDSSRHLAVEVFDWWMEGEGGGSAHRIGNAITYTENSPVVVHKRHYYDDEYNIKKTEHVYPTDD